MALRASIVLTPLFLKHDDRSSPALIDDLRRDLCAFDQRLSDEEAFVAMHQSYIAQFYRASDVAWKTFNLNERPVFDPILLAACFHYCVHECCPP